MSSVQATSAAGHASAPCKHVDTWRFAPVSPLGRGSWWSSGLGQQEGPSAGRRTVESSWGVGGGRGERKACMLLKRALPVGAVLIAAGSIVWSAAAASAVSEHKITEMERIAPVTIKHGPTHGERHYEYAGIAEGHIGTLLVRGAALRSSGALNTGSG